MKKHDIKAGYRETHAQTFLFSEAEVKLSQRCSVCKKTLTEKDTPYTLTQKGKTEIYCQPCAKRKLRPREEAAEA